MRIVLLLLLAACCCRAAAQSGAPLTTFDVLHYNFTIEVSDRSDTIYATAAITVKALGAVRMLEFDLAETDKKTGRGMEVTAVSGHNGAAISYTHNNDRLLVAQRFEPGSEGIITIHYKGIPANGLVIGKNKFGQRTFFGDNWPNRARHWLACVDHPLDKATVEWRVLAPAHYTVTANGVLTGEYLRQGGRKQWIFNETHPIPAKVAVIGVARLQMERQTVNGCLPVYNYVYPETDTTGLKKMAVAADIVKFFSATLGAYPYDKLANVQSTTMFGGMENANNIFYDETAVAGDFDMEALVAHEIAHQWFGNTVTEKSFAHLWLSEGFATFLTNYYLEKKYGADTLQKRLAEDRTMVRNFLKSSQRPVVDNSTNYMGLLNPNSYQKGGLFLQALREKTGDEKFFAVIRAFYERFKFTNADTEDFRKVVEEMAGGDWQPFFKEWLYSTKLPE